jgi:hypothetical protein
LIRQPHAQPVGVQPSLSPRRQRNCARVR